MMVANSTNITTPAPNLTIATPAPTPNPEDSVTPKTITAPLVFGLMLVYFFYRKNKKENGKAFNVLERCVCVAPAIAYHAFMIIITCCADCCNGIGGGKDKSAAAIKDAKISLDMFLGIEPVSLTMNRYEDQFELRGQQNTTSFEPQIPSAPPGSAPYAGQSRVQTQYQIAEQEPPQALPVHNSSVLQDKLEQIRQEIRIKVSNGEIAYGEKTAIDQRRFLIFLLNCGIDAETATTYHAALYDKISKLLKDDNVISHEEMNAWLGIQENPKLQNANDPNNVTLLRM